MPEQARTKKAIKTKLPLAVFFMVLIDSENLALNGKHKEEVMELTAPYYSHYDTKHIATELFDNTGALTCAKDDSFYKKILKNIYKYHFNNLIKLFKHFYNINDISSVNTIDDIKKCYEIMFENRTDTPNTTFSPEYCWSIAKLFSKQNYSVESIETTADFHKIRKEIIKNATGTLYLAGTTLKDALSTAKDYDDVSIIDDIFNNKNIHTVNIFLLHYVYVNINQEDASDEIVRSINNIFLKVNRPIPCPKINIVLLSDFDIKFSLITQDVLLTRSTHLFTKERCYRGQYLLFTSTSDEYLSMYNYFDFLLMQAYDVDIYSKKKSPYDIKKTLRDNAKLREFIKYKKVHPIQLENLVRGSFMENNSKNNFDFSSELNLDNTQRVLMPYLKETEQLLEKVVKQHDHNGWAKIIPSPDLGFPNNITRIAGGFLTGALYDWSCTVPIIPIDATVNSCTSSVFKLDGFDINMTNEQFGAIVSTLCEKSMDNGYAFNLKSGNHFLMVSKDDYNNYYLVLHSSAKQSKESCFGLYPSERAWFNNDIKTEYNDKQTRYIRYIRGDAAVRFYDYANRFREFNEEIHYYVAYKFAKLCNTKISQSYTPVMQHHYGMPTSTSIAIGTFVVNTYPNDKHDLIIPVFSDYGKDVCLYELSSQQKRTYTLAGTNKEVVLVPHGWGQVIDGIRSLKIDNPLLEQHRKLVLNFSDTSVSHDVIPSARIKLSQKHVRHFPDVNTFIKDSCPNLNGNIKKILHPVFCYCERSFLDKNNPSFKLQ